jgi:hypothetical protein
MVAFSEEKTLERREDSRAERNPWQNLKAFKKELKGRCGTFWKVSCTRSESLP